MRKIIYGAVILTALLVSGNLDAQAYNRCYSSGDNISGGVEKTFIKLWIDANKVEISYRKYSANSTGTSYISMSKQGIIEGNKIVLTNIENKNENNVTEQEGNTVWLFREDSLIVGEDVLLPAGCN